MTSKGNDWDKPYDSGVEDLMENIDKLKRRKEEIEAKAGAVNDAILRSTKKQALETEIILVETRITTLEIDISMLGDPSEVQKQLDEKRQELAELKSRLKHEFPETKKHWWQALLFWRKS